MKYLSLLIGMLLSISLNALAIGESPFVLKVDAQLLEKGKEQLIEVKAATTKSLIGYQFALELSDQVQILDIIPGEIPELGKHNFGLHKISEGLIFTNWFSGQKRNFTENEVIFTIKVNAKANISTVDLISINDVKMVGEAYKSDGEHFDVEMIFSQKKNAVATGLLIYPNPVTGPISIQSNIKEGTAFELLSPSGRMIKTYLPKNYTLKNNNINVSDIPSGMYLLRWTDQEGNIFSEKLLKI